MALPDPVAGDIAYLEQVNFNPGKAPVLLAEMEVTWDERATVVIRVDCPKPDDDTDKLVAMEQLSKRVLVIAEMICNLPALAEGRPWRPFPRDAEK